MKTIAKVAIGCGVALVLAGSVAVALLVGGAYWVKGKVEQVTDHEQRIQDLKKKAGAAAPFSRPKDGVIQEARLVRFLEIRSRLLSIYERHRPEIERLNKKEKGDLSDAWKAFSWINELRRAHAEAQADAGMGDEEYAFLVEQVYRSAWAAEQVSGKQAEGPLESTSQEQRRPIEEMLEQVEAQKGEVLEQARPFDVPKANLELIRKHEAEIKRYAMNGLEWLGL